MRLLLLILMIFMTAPADGMPFSEEHNSADAITKKADKAFERLKLAAGYFDAGDCKSALRLASPLVDEKEPALLPKLLALAYDVVVQCEFASNQSASAYLHAVRGSGLQYGSDYLWRARLAFELDNGRHEAAVETLESMTLGRGAALNSVPLNWMWQLLRNLKNAQLSRLRERALKILSDGSYAPDEILGETDQFRFEYALILRDKDQIETARTLVQGLQNPDTLMLASLDPRTRSFFSQDPDIRAATERALARARAAIREHPDFLIPLLEAARYLRSLGQPQDSLDLLKTVSTTIDDANSFKDRDERLVWWWDAIGRGYSMLGKYDDAARGFEKGGALTEGANLNVSQVINLAEMYNGLGRHEEALKTLGVFSDPSRRGSPYGESEMRFARGCALANSGHQLEASNDLAYVRDHEKDHPEALSDLLLCMGDVDSAAASFVRRLDNPETRTSALRQLSDYDPPLVVADKDPIGPRFEALKKRSDVVEAARRAGGVRRFNIQGTGL